MKIASTQHGLVTYSQLRTEGWTKMKIHRELEKGSIERVLHGVYRFTAAPITQAQRLMAVLLSIGPPSILSHTTAAEIHSLNFWRDDRIHVTVSSSVSSYFRPGTAIHHSSKVPSTDVILVDALNVSSVARTLVDLAEYSTTPMLGIAIDDALQKRIVTLSEIKDCFESVGRWRGRKRFVAAKEAIEDRVGLSQVESALERRVLKVIQESELADPIAQYVVVAGDRTYRLDFAYPEQMVGLEVDGYAFHSSRESFDRDRRRDNDLRRSGWNVIHFTSTSTWSEIVRDVAVALHQATSGFSPQNLSS